MTQQIAGSVSIKQLSKSYPITPERSRVLFEDINLEIKAGDFISLLGQKGSGKSTLLRLLVGLEHQYQGEILVDGEKVYGTSPKRAILFQDHRLFPWLNIRENVRIALHQSNLSRIDEDILIDEYLNLVQLTQFENAYPTQLSAGMNHRVALARSLVTQPDILLLDDPFGTLDAVTRQSLQEELQRIWTIKKITVILATHDLDEAVFLGHQVIALKNEPSTIERRIDIPLAYPRKRGDIRFQTLKNNLSEELLSSKQNTTVTNNKKFGDCQFTW